MQCNIKSKKDCKFCNSNIGLYSDSRSFCKYFNRKSKNADLFSQYFVTAFSNICVNIPEYNFQNNTDIPSRVPQGSHCGSLMRQYIDRALTNIQGRIFTDDVKIYSIIQNVFDVIELQSFLENFCEWAKTNDMTLNTNSLTMSFSSNPFLQRFGSNILKSVDNI